LRREGYTEDQQLSVIQKVCVYQVPWKPWSTETEAGFGDFLGGIRWAMGRRWEIRRPSAHTGTGGYPVEGVRRSEGWTTR